MLLSPVVSYRPLSMEGSDDRHQEALHDNQHGADAAGALTRSISYDKRTGETMKATVLVCLLLIPLASCTVSSTASDFHGLRDVDGSIPTHINSTHYALQLFVALPLIGDASLKTAVSEFTKEAKELGGTRVRIVQSDTTRLWWILPPLSLIFTPSWTNVAGDVLRPERTAPLPPTVQ